MKIISFLLACIPIITYKTETKRISSGTNAKRDQFPFFAQFFNAKIENDGFSNDSSLCGATLIHPQWVLSSASCFPVSKKAVKPDIMMLFMATNQLFDVAKGDTRAIIQHYVHPKYNLKKYSNGNIITTSNDIAIGKLETPYDLNEHIQVITFPPRGPSREKLPKCTSGTVVGIGMYKFHPPDYFQFEKYVNVTVTKVKELKVKVQTSKTQFYTQTPFKGKLEYLGDNGGPFLCYVQKTAIIYGVTSWVANDSDSKTVTAAYEAVDVHINFILSHVRVLQFYGGKEVFPKGHYRRNIHKSPTSNFSSSVLFYFPLIIFYIIVRFF